jgi:hypothetical protein
MPKGFPAFFVSNVFPRAAALESIMIGITS